MATATSPFHNDNTSFQYILPPADDLPYLGKLVLDCPFTSAFLFLFYLLKYKLILRVKFVISYHSTSGEVYIFGMEMSQRIYFCQQISLKMSNFGENEKIGKKKQQQQQHFWWKKLLDRLQKSILS